MGWDSTALAERFERNRYVDFGSAVGLVGTQEFSTVRRSLDADHGILPLLLDSCVMILASKHHKAVLAVR